MYGEEEEEPQSNSIMETLLTSFIMGYMKKQGVEMPPLTNAVQPQTTASLSNDTIIEMNEDDVDTNEEFDPVGVSKGLTRLVIIFDSIIVAKEWIEKNNLNLDYKKKGNDENLILQVNMSSNYGI
jgi:hypothetical protein